jgi:aspartyl-tRNA(Asn)/glutamyl-tRNA(Gln) amidotransferase subunit A
VTVGLCALSAAEIRTKVARRDVSAEEVMRAHLDRVGSLEPVVEAFLRLAPERALERARRLDSALTGGAPAPALAGVPTAVKDIIHVAGLPTTCGSRLLADYLPPFEATVVTRLEAQGAIVLGKTNMDEFAMGSSTEHSAFKPTRNPWDRERVPGGSSGGSGAAVASRMVPLALGTDTGGSIRQPAALCGVSGLKPTWGRASRYGLVAFASSLDQVGPLARNVEDLAIASSVLCGHDPADATSSPRPVPDFASALGGGAAGLRLGVPRRSLAEGVDGETLARFDDALRALEAAGATIMDVELPHLAHAIAAYYLVATAEASSNLARYDGVRYGARATGAPDLRRLYGETRDQGFGAEVKRRILLGTFALSSGYYDAYYLRAQKVRTLIRRDFEQAFASCDAIATPTTPAPAFRFGEKTADPLQMYLADIFTVPANLAGLPALSIPCGLASGLPVGLQLVGRPFEEVTLLRAGAAYQKVTSHHELAPPLTPPIAGSVTGVGD